MSHWRAEEARWMTSFCSKDMVHGFYSYTLSQLKWRDVNAVKMADTQLTTARDGERWTYNVITKSPLMKEFGPISVSLSTEPRFLWEQERMREWKSSTAECILSPMQHYHTLSHAALPRVLLSQCATRFMSSWSCTTHWFGFLSQMVVGLRHMQFVAHCPATSGGATVSSTATPKSSTSVDLVRRQTSMLPIFSHL